MRDSAMDAGAEANIFDETLAFANLAMRSGLVELRSSFAIKLSDEPMSASFFVSL